MIPSRIPIICLGSFDCKLVHRIAWTLKPALKLTVIIIHADRLRSLHQNDAISTIQYLPHTDGAAGYLKKTASVLLTDVVHTVLSYYTYVDLPCAQRVSRRSSAH